ncbi:NAD-binding protein [Halorubrum sp. CBA1125]|uniref:NAD-binding protein n=1 Tax=Halorubrum sp. CBA1125 TaxID=2668072 RepID=UPI002AA29BB0|nr:NAD-binding protein [Halorubrum sp. CBA1125]
MPRRTSSPPTTRSRPLTTTRSSTISTRRRRSRGDVVAGLGVVGRAVTTALSNAGFAYTTIDVGDDPTVDVVGDATDRDVLREAGITDAGTIVLALPDDTAAIYATSPSAN